MNITTLLTIAGVPVYLHTDGHLSFTAGAMIDADGSGPRTKGDTYLPDTSLHYQGKPLNASVDRFVALPPRIIKAVAPVVLGCRVRLTNTKNGKVTEAVSGDVGPAAKLGEISVAAAIALGIPASPISGGVTEKVVLYELFPGVPAVVNGREYRLQRAA